MTDAAGQRVVYGLHAVTELLRRQRGHVAALFFQEGHEGQDGPEEKRGGLGALQKEARRLGLMPIEQRKGALDSLARGGVHQGVVALCGEYAYATVADILQAARAAGAPPLLLLLDGVTNPQNLGALLRSAHVLGGHGVVIPQDRAAPVTPAVVKAACGATELVPVARVTNLVRAMEELKREGVWLSAAVAGQRSQPPWAVDLRGPAGLVLGSEDRGLRPLVRKTCDFHIEIPMAGGLHGASLNVSAAGAALLYEALRQRRGAAET